MPIPESDVAEMDRTLTRLNRVHLVCGAPTHDTDLARLELLKLLGEDPRNRVTVGSDFADIDTIGESDAIVVYTCNLVPDDAQIDALDDFLTRGGRMFAMHATNAQTRFIEGPPVVAQGITIPGQVDTKQSNPRYTRLIGSRMIAHLEYREMTLEAATNNPLVAGIVPLTIEDEPYIMELTDDCEVLLTARFSGNNPGYVEGDWPEATDRAQMYLRPHGKGGVLYLAPGHCSGKYDLRPLMDEGPVLTGPWFDAGFRELVRRSLAWAVRA